MRYLVKDIDHFAGFAHAIHTYLGGVALADFHNMSLLHTPFQSSHGLGFAFEDFLAGDSRQLVAPQAAPVLTVDRHARLFINGVPATVSTTPRTASAAQIAQRLREAPDRSVTWVRKGRFAFLDSDPISCVNCSQTPENRYTALWIRERFWRAVRAREQQQADEQKERERRHRRDRASGSSSGGGGAGVVAGGGVGGGSMLNKEGPVDPIVVAIHVRRGDVTYLDRYSKPSARWVETADMLEVLRGVRTAIGRPLEPPAVQVHLFSEAKGWFRNDTQALTEVAPRARVHLDSGASATIDALITMSRADVLLMGSSGFSTWSAIFSCGVKIGPRGKPMMPMRHVPFSNTLVARSGDFSEVALPTLRRVWGEYWQCKRDPACRPTLCAAKHLTDPAWTTSRLAQQCVAHPHGAQWLVPSEPPGAATSAGLANDAAAAGARDGSDGSDGSDDMRARDVEGWLDARRGCALKAGALKGGTAGLVACVRSRWSRNVSSSPSLKSRLATATAANNSAAAAATSAAPTSSSSSAAAAEGPSTPAPAASNTASPAAIVRRPTKTIQRDGKSFMVWADRML